MSLDTIRNDPDGLSAWFERLNLIFGEMDAAYARAAGGSGFVCRGCRDNCCRTRFHHHTLLEYLSVCRGFRQLPAPQQADAKKRAADVLRAYAAADAAGDRVRAWCPLNQNGRCLVYACRPMICRMHGIPHELRHPGGGTVRGPGCSDFDRQRRGDDACPLDRTPHYTAMAALEKALRGHLGFEGKLKLTIAEMVDTF